MSENCISIDDCNKAINGKLTDKQIPLIVNFLKKDFYVKNPLRKFVEPYYPRIEIKNSKKLNKQMISIKNLGINGITISLNDIFSLKEEFFIKERFFHDLHYLLDYHGKIILTTNIHDKFCKILIENPNKILKILKTLNPDAFTTFDANFYYTLPTFIILIQWDKVNKLNKKVYNTKIKQIGLIPPVKKPFFKIFFLSQLIKNHKTIAIPMLELNKIRNTEHIRFKQEIISQCLEYYSKFKFKYILLSTSPNNNLYANSFSSLSWLIKKDKNFEFNDNWKNKENRIIRYRKKAKKMNAYKIKYF
ncbi:MAG: hypothetical protein ACTSVV_00040 [Promethearchaeota archaeon]